MRRPLQNRRSRNNPRYALFDYTEQGNKDYNALKDALHKATRAARPTDTVYMQLVAEAIVALHVAHDNLGTAAYVSNLQRPDDDINEQVKDALTLVTAALEALGEPLNRT